ncbi:MAG: hypothetical protein V3R89_02330 [Thermoanaerobaculia bacterium]
MVAGGRRATLRLDYRAPGTQAKQAVLVVRAGQRRLAQRRLRRDGVWRSLQLDLGAWPAGAPLVLALESPARMPRRTHIILHRARLSWSRD